MGGPATAHGTGAHNSGKLTPDRHRPAMLPVVNTPVAAEAVDPQRGQIAADHPAGLLGQRQSLAG